MEAKKVGRGGGDASLGLDELLIPRVKWVSQIREFIQTSFVKQEETTFRRLNRRFLAQDMYLPTMQGNSVSKLILAPDVSGSMLYDGRYERCMTEIQGLAEQLHIDEVHIMYWDSKVIHETYTGEEFKNWKDKTRPKGGGGTDVGCVSDYIRENRIDADAVIVFTDGDVTGWGKWTMPVLFAITNKFRNIEVPIGKKIVLED